ncbi:MAG: CRISPR-associated endonuclease Cas2 [Lachnospira sp.]|nr:CRISPR-associated endonuclease Cas2 [Lachnospira sp.]
MNIKMIFSYMCKDTKDISNDKLRTRFSKYLSRFGHRLQYSVFEIDNSPRIIDNIVNDLKNKYEKSFGQEDSVIIFKLSSSCEVLRFGYAKNDEKDFLIIT